MIGRLNHVAIAVPDLEAGIAQYRDVLGAKVSEPQDEPDHGVTVVFVELPNTKIELLYPLGENSPIQGFLAVRVFLAMANLKSGPMANLCCSCIPRISTGHWLNSNRFDFAEISFTAPGLAKQTGRFYLPSR